MFETNFNVLNLFIKYINHKINSLFCFTIACLNSMFGKQKISEIRLPRESTQISRNLHLILLPDRALPYQLSDLIESRLRRVYNAPLSF